MLWMKQNRQEFCLINEPECIMYINFFCLESHLKHILKVCQFPREISCTEYLIRQDVFILLT